MDERTERLMRAAEVGNINSLYVLIGEDASLLESFDGVPFIDTPLHKAAASGHFEFSMEMMNLKPSFARKLNKAGFSPMHLALQNGHANIVYELLYIDKDLVRVKGREGMTPLHYVAERGDHLDFLAKFLCTCEESIQDLTVRSETALHIAVKNNMFEAIEVLVGWLQRTNCKGAQNGEQKVLNWKDVQGNTVLHIATSKNQPQVVRSLINRSVNTNAKNLEGLTALDILESQAQLDTREVRDFLCRAGALRASSLPSVTAPADFLRSKLSFNQKFQIAITRTRNNLSSEMHNMIIVVAVLIASTTYQTVLSPPGGVWQDNYSPPSILNGSTIHVNTTSSHLTGRSVLSEVAWQVFMSFNTFTFSTSIIAILFLLPRGINIIGLYACALPLFLLLCCYTGLVLVIRPTPLDNTQIIMSIIIICFALVPNWILSKGLLKVARRPLNHLTSLRRRMATSHSLP